MSLGLNFANIAGYDAAFRLACDNKIFTKIWQESCVQINLWQMSVIELAKNMLFF